MDLITSIDTCSNDWWWCWLQWPGVVSGRTDSVARTTWSSKLIFMVKRNSSEDFVNERHETGRAQIWVTTSGKYLLDSLTFIQGLFTLEKANGESTITLWLCLPPVDVNVNVFLGPLHTGLLAIQKCTLCQRCPLTLTLAERSVWIEA